MGQAGYAAAHVQKARGRTVGPQSIAEAAVQPVPEEISGFISRMLDCCMDIRDVWLIGQDENGPDSSGPRWELLAFADPTTLQRLRKANDLHRADVDVLVVTDGDRFENAWGQHRLSGSLVRWAWRRAVDGEAFYNEARWAGEHEQGEVVRVRRKAVLLWHAGR